MRSKKRQLTKSKVIAAKKLVNKQKKKQAIKKSKGNKNCGVKRRFVLDANVNVKFCKWNKV